MSFFIGKDREARRAYGFDEVAIVPGTITINPEDVDTSISLGPITVKIPILASAMDAVTSPEIVALMSSYGALAVLNLDGIYVRYANPKEALDKIAKAKESEAPKVVQEVYSKEPQEELIAKRIKEIKSKKGIVAVSTVPQNAARYGFLAAKAGADFFIIQATVVTARHISNGTETLDLANLAKKIKIPLIVGNCVTYGAALELMETGAIAVLVGVGPGHACTSRQVLGVGVPQVTAIADCAKAREAYLKKTGRYVLIIADGGMANGGDLCKAIACGADAVMLGSAFAKAKEAPGRGYHWGMAMPSRYLPRGTRVYVGQTGTLKQILFGPSLAPDGSQNLVGALKTCMGYVGARTIREMQMAQLIIAPEIKTEGKALQAGGRCA